MKRITKPHQDERVAEFVGIHYGDGNLNALNYTYRITISLHRDLDRDYSEYVRYLFCALFDTQLKIRDHYPKRLRNLQCCSKQVLQYLRDVWACPVGKKDELRIPRQLIGDRSMFFAFIRGLFDTDGCVFIRDCQRYQYPVIKITNKSEAFLSQLSLQLNGYGFRSYVNYSGPAYDLVINGWQQKQLWAGMIGSNNARNLRLLYGDARI